VLGRPAQTGGMASPETFGKLARVLPQNNPAA
jgi:hypothetical protein